MATVLPVAYLNGEFVDIEQARIPALDRGFLFGDGVYEVVPYFAGRSLLLREHVSRLERSLLQTGIANPNSAAQWSTLLDELVERNGGGDQAAYLQVTRGADVKRDHAFPANVAPTVFAMCSVLQIDFDHIALHGVAAVTAEDTRWKRCDIKSTSLQANCMLRELAARAGANETILLHEGMAREGSTSSLFTVRDDVVKTTPNSPAILPGTTRDLVLKLARAQGLHCVVADITENELRSADEIWLASATRKLVPVTRLDGAAVGSGKPGACWQRIIAAFDSREEPGKPAP